MPEGGARFAGRGAAATAGERARRALAGTRFADVRWLESTGSTNSDAMALARQGEPEGVVVVADHQTAGRGRRDRTWVAPPRSSLLVSVLLRPPARVAGASTMAAGVALVDAVARVAGVRAGLKWPNDLVVDAGGGERKLAGILAEADWPAGSTISGGYRPPRPDERTVVVVGVGVNVCWPPPPDGEGAAAGRGTGAGAAAAGAEGPPAGLADVATALNRVGPQVDRVDLLVGFLGLLGERYTALVAAGAADLVGAWRERSTTLGRRVRVDLGADDLEGTARDVTEEGHLVVETLEGARRVLAVGDVVHLRAR